MNSLSPERPDCSIGEADRSPGRDRPSHGIGLFCLMVEPGGEIVWVVLTPVPSFGKVLAQTASEVGGPDRIPIREPPWIRYRGQVSSSRPLNSPTATKTEVVGKIIYLRQNYHFGPHKISMYLARYHDITISPSGVWNILRRFGISRPPTSQRHKRHKDRWKRYEKPLRGHRVQVDVKFIQPLAGARKKEHYQFTAVDDCTRIRVLRIYPHKQPTLGNPVPQLRPREAAVSGPNDPNG